MHLIFLRCVLHVMATVGSVLLLMLHLVHCKIVQANSLSDT
jgi:hypothetical protein